MLIRYKRMALLALLTGMLGCGPQGSNNDESSDNSVSTITRKPDQVSPSKSPSVMDPITLGVLSTLVDVTNDTSSILGIFSFFAGLGEPSNSQILNELSIILEDVESIQQSVQKITALEEAILSETNSNNASQIAISINNEISNYADAAANDLQVYLKAPNGPGAGNYRATADSDSYSAVQDLSPGLSLSVAANYQQTWNGQTFWTPVFATIPFEQALAYRLTVIAGLYPSTFSTSYKQEVCLDYGWVSGLAAQTKSFAANQCQNTPTSVVVTTCNTHGACTRTTLYGYSISCAIQPIPLKTIYAGGVGVSNLADFIQTTASGNIYKTAADASAAMQPILTAGQQQWVAALGVAQINTIAANLLSLAGGSCP